MTHAGRALAFGGGVVVAAALVAVAAAGMTETAVGRRSAELGVALSAGAALAVLGLKAVAVRRSLQAALGLSVLGFVVRLAVWAVGYGVVRSRTWDAGPYTLGFFALFVMALVLEVTYVLSAARAARGDG